MTSRTVTIISDDFTGEENASQVTFSFAGTDYTIDLTEENRLVFEQVLRPYLDVASVAKRPTTRSIAGAKHGGVPVSVVREWAKGQGLQVSDRGRVSEDIWAAYFAGHAA